MEKKKKRRALERRSSKELCSRKMLVMLMAGGYNYKLGDTYSGKRAIFACIFFMNTNPLSMTREAKRRYSCIACNDQRCTNARNVDCKCLKCSSTGFFQGRQAAPGAPSRRDEGRQTDGGNWPCYHFNVIVNSC